jgi:hypothetical protein
MYYFYAILALLAFMFGGLKLLQIGLTTDTLLVFVIAAVLVVAAEITTIADSIAKPSKQQKPTV